MISLFIKENQKRQVKELFNILEANKTLIIKYPETLFTENEIESIKNEREKFFYSLFSNKKPNIEILNFNIHIDCILFGIYYRKYTDNIEIIEKYPGLIQYTNIFLLENIDLIEDEDYDLQFEDEFVYIENIRYHCIKDFKLLKLEAVINYITNNIDIFSNMLV